MVGRPRGRASGGRAGLCTPLDDRAVRMLVNECI